MRILHIIGGALLPADPERAGASGVVRAVLEIARAQAKLGHHVAVASAQGERWQCWWQGVTLISLATTTWATLQVRGAKLDFRQHLPYILCTRRYSADVVHTHLHSYMRFLHPGLRVAHVHADPFHDTLCGQGLNLGPADLATIRRHTDVQVAVSHFVAGELERGLGRPGAVPVVHNGVDSALFDPAARQTEAADLRRRWGVQDQEVVFLFAGALVVVKGVIPLIHAFTRLLARFPEAHLVLAGASSLWENPVAPPHEIHGAEAAIQHELARMLGSGRVHLPGKVEATAMPATYAASDVVVVPSLWREAFPLVALEAMASGRPVIASRIGGLPEAVSNRVGVLVRPGDEGELAGAMECLARDRALRLGLGAAGRHEAGLFSWDTAASRLDQIYQDAAADRRRARRRTAKACADS